MKLFDIIMRKSKIHLDCYTDQLATHTYTPIELSNKHYPEWWKVLPKTFKTNDPLIEPSTMKRCVGFINFFQNSATLPMWSDLKIRVGKDSKEGISWLFSRIDSMIEIHDANQWSGYVDTDEHQHVKLRSPWLFSCKEDVKFAFVGNSWEFPNIIIPPGVVDYKYQAVTSVNLFVKYTGESHIITLPAGKSLAHIIPLSEKELVVHSHHDPDKYSKLMAITVAETTFENLYNTNKKILKAKNLCPYHLIRK